MNMTLVSHTRGTTYSEGAGEQNRVLKRIFGPKTKEVAGG